MKSAAIFSKPAKPELAQIVPELLRWLGEHGYQVVVDHETAAYASVPEVVERVAVAAREPKFVVVLGGDGTLLAAARAVAKAGIPVLGVNLGSLGFLTEVPLADLYATLEAVDQKKCGTEPRSMLSCHLLRDGKCVAQYHALNDVVVNKSSIARLADFDLYINQDFVSNYKADGLIVATPTGSTAYSLAAGGPILMPSVEGFVITPVSPHALTHRPLVVRDSVEISIVVKAAEEHAFLSVDGQVGMPLNDGDRVTCRKSKHQVQLLRMKKTFFDVLRTKLKWGQR
ncbi:MAG TPA: NAD(+)/NADH kinase [Terriglobales bacterium]|jgi:NAD+ kinase|nr:NAD(+)/NADH kinase [Terriglobales bacterium]